MFTKLLGGAAIAVLLLAPIAAAQSTFPVDFSADRVSYPIGHPETVVPGEFYVGKGRIRQEVDAPGGTRITIFDPVRKRMWMLSPERKMAADMSPMLEMFGAMAGSKSGELSLKPADPSHPCAGFEGTTCQKVGVETVNGRSTQKWEFTHTMMGRTFKTYQWIDPKLYIAVRHQDEHNVIELRNIREGPQPDGSFEVPADYHVMTGQEKGGRPPH